MNVLITGYGNIGTTLVELLLRYRQLLGVDELLVLRRAFADWEQVAMERLVDRGVTLCTEEGGAWPSIDEVSPRVHFVLHCGPNGSGLVTRPRYDRWPKLIGALAQGSEKGFGIPFMSGVGGERVDNARFVQVVSCNTHGLASILQWLCGPRLEELVSGDAVIVRRSEDLGGHERLVGANVVARHRDPTHGTHHARDVVDLFAELDVEPNVVSSDITTPSQLTHSLRFSVQVGEGCSLEERINAIDESTYLGTTELFDSNRIFETGRRSGFSGRLYEHAIVVSNNLLRHGSTVRGWAFIPQEGNVLLSTLEGFLRQTGHNDLPAVLERLHSDLLIGRI